jgi:hypothetical protein
MTIADYQELINKAFEVITFDNGKDLSHYLTKEKRNELTLKLVHFIPSSHDMIINSIFRRVLSYIPVELIQEVLTKREKELILKRISNTITIEEEKLLIFYMQLSLKLKTQSSIYSSMEEIQQFFESFIINDVDMLQAEIITNNVSGHTMEIQDHYVRCVLGNYDLIPTIQTEENFINYLKK